MVSKGRRTAQSEEWIGEAEGGNRPAARPRIATISTDEAPPRSREAAFYDLICIGWLALAAASIWIAILY